jgi:HSP20 family molecular chaperone IbpA
VVRLLLRELAVKLGVLLPLFLALAPRALRNQNKDQARMSFFDDWFFSDPFFRAPAFHTMLAPFESTLNLAAHEVADGVEVELEVPRYRAEDIKVTTSVDTGLVTIEGKREQRDAAAASTHTATTVPAFRRSFTVSPRRYDLTKLTSKVEDGLLVIRIPRKAAESPKKLEAKAQPVSIAGTLAPQITESKSADAKDTGKVALWGAMPQWPPRLQVTERSAPGVAMTYTVALPEKVQPENVKLQVYDDGALRVDVAYSTRKESEHGFEEHSASFTRFLQLPEGTPQDAVSARFEGGQLKIDVKEVAKK